MTVIEAAKSLEISVATVYGLCKCGKLPHERHGLGRGAIRITPSQLAEYREGASVRPPTPATRPIRAAAGYRAAMAELEAMNARPRRR